MRSKYCFPYWQRNVFGCQPFTSHLHNIKVLASPSLLSVSPLWSWVLHYRHCIAYQYLFTLQNAACTKVQCSIGCSTRCKSTDWKCSLCFEVQFVHNDNAIHCPEQVQQSSAPWLTTSQCRMFQRRPNNAVKVRWGLWQSCWAKPKQLAIRVSLHRSPDSHFFPD